MTKRDFLPQALENISNVSTRLIHKYHHNTGRLPNSNQIVAMLCRDFPKSIDAVGVHTANDMATRQILAFGASLTID